MRWQRAELAAAAAEADALYRRDAAIAAGSPRLRRGGPRAPARARARRGRVVQRKCRAWLRLRPARLTRAGMRRKPGHRAGHSSKTCHWTNRMCRARHRGIMMLTGKSGRRSVGDSKVAGRAVSARETRRSLWAAAVMCEEPEPGSPARRVRAVTTSRTRVLSSVRLRNDEQCNAAC